MSANGGSAYTAGLDGLGVFARRRDGALTQLAGRRGCVSKNGSEDHFERRGSDCLISRSLTNPLDVDVSPDGRHVYAGGTLIQGGGVQSQISIFARTPR